MLILLVMTFIGIFFLTLIINIFKFSAKNLFSFGLIGLIVCQMIWQSYVGVLYIPELLSQNQAEFLFRLLRIGALATPTMIFLILTESLSHSQEKIGFMNKVFTRRNFYIYSVITLIFYILNWTTFSVEKLKFSNVGLFLHFFPVYGTLGWIQLVQSLMITVWLLFGIYIAIKMKNEYLKAFNKIFCTICMIGSVIGLMNFIEKYTIFTTLITCVMFTVAVLFAFIQFREKVMEHERKLEVEKVKIDYVKYATSSLIHEIRNPLTVLDGYFQLMKINKNLDADAKRMLDVSHNSSKHMQEILNDFVAFINTNEIKTEHKSINKMIEKIMNMMEEKSKENSVMLHPLDKVDDIFLYMDESKLSQVFINLYKNAIEAMESSEKEKHIYTKISLCGNNLLIEIKDTGDGIPNEIMETIFKPFHTSKEKGTGIGLSICQNIITAHKGSIEVKETNESGTTFLLTLPVEDYTEMFKK